MKLSQTEAYAVSAVAQLAANPAKTLISARVIAEAGGMPDRYLLQIMRKLTLGGIVKSTRGVMGGYVLAKPANKITLLEVIEAVSGPLGGQDNDLIGSLAKPSQATLAKALDAVTADAKKRLSGITAADLKTAGKMPKRKSA